ncbi:MAG: zinc chelation protein SecC [Verrucomicrobia bacterium]|nr:zinc chelation protein SecC [Verrucomicrobiota bacterium]
MEVRVFSWAIMTPCPCHSGESYSKCCKPFHEGTLPKNALQLMRSRYSAFALNLPDYIIQTTHPANREYSPDHQAWKESISYFSQCSKFIGLTIHDFKEKGMEASVTFTANISRVQNGKLYDASFTENSYFEKVNQKWLYAAGDTAKSLQELLDCKFEWF